MTDEEQAKQVRIEWMRMMGVDEEEIQRLCQPDAEPLLNLADELEQLEAAQRVRICPMTQEDLLRLVEHRKQLIIERSHEDRGD